MRIRFRREDLLRTAPEYGLDMGWSWIKDDVDVPELTERANFRDVLLKERLATALQRINLRNGVYSPGHLPHSHKSTKASRSTYAQT